MNNKNNKALSQFKTEIATELGMSNYDQVDKGQLTSRQNGYVGGNMTKKMVAYAEQALAAGQSSAINSAVQTQHMNQANQMNQ